MIAGIAIFIGFLVIYLGIGYCIVRFVKKKKRQKRWLMIWDIIGWILIFLS